MAILQPLVEADEIMAQPKSHLAARRQGRLARNWHG
jgi:hypothetical protein